QLEYIIAVDTYRHFVNAAEKCFVTQPTLSMQIKKLEESLGVIIFDRTKQPIIPTEIGKKIIEQARITVAESKKINELVKEENNIISGEISIGIIPSLAPYLLPLFIGKFTKKHPEVTVKIIELLTNEIISELKKDTLDVGILVTPLHENGIIEEVLFYEEMKVLCHKSHSLSNKKIIKIGELENPGLWLLNNGHCFRSQVVNLCNYKDQTNTTSNFEYESGSLETIKKLIDLEGGYSLIPELATTQNNSKTITIPIENNPLREVSFAYTRNYNKKRLLTIMANEIKAVIPETLNDKSRGFIVEWK
ncbi:MAG: hydrogen peroxide-inducible genes activator, partial [Vicingaceae bacterium]|nr:hydrogen peroxide-inducible genes activator [Vicingaceae bacterium]